MDIARIICGVLVPVFRLRRICPDGTPYRGKIRGGALIAGNHTSFADPFIMGVAFWYRRTFFLVAEVVMKNPVVAFFLRGVGAIRIDRGSTDIEAIGKSVKVLKQGYLLTMFPQGGIQRTEQDGPLKAGAVLIALRAGVPIVPVYIAPRRHWYSRVTVVIGQTLQPDTLCPKKFPSASDLQHATDLLAQQFEQCQKPFKGE